MNVATEQIDSVASDGNNENEGYIGRIPVRNLWLLMLYASDLFQTGGMGKIGLEDNPDDIPDLVAEILAHAVELRQRRHLTLGYRTQHAVLNRVRGRIDVLTTERHQLLARGLVKCRFDELSVNTVRNRFVRFALETISRLVQRNELAHRCRSLANDMKAMGVSGTAPTRTQIDADSFGRIDSDDRIMVAAAKLALDLALPTETNGLNVMRLPDREIAWVRKLFEKAIGGFYKVALSHLGWQVYCGRQLNWQIEQKTQGIDNILPTMRTDIVLDHIAYQRRIVIDTKFNSIVTNGWYREKTLRSGYLYQIYTYLRSQVGCGDDLADIASGQLLHPSVHIKVDESVLIQGHNIRFSTVDLTASHTEIRNQLLNLCV